MACLPSRFESQCDVLHTNADSSPRPPSRGHLFRARLRLRAHANYKPIVMISIGDPVRAGLVPSVARPGGNITGNSVLGPDVGAKRLQILKEVIPTVSRVAFLWNPDNASNVLQFEEIQAAAPMLGVTVISVSVSPRIEFETAFAAMMKERPDALA